MPRDPGAVQGEVAQDAGVAEVADVTEDEDDVAGPLHDDPAPVHEDDGNPE